MVELPKSVQKVLDVDALCDSVFEGLESNQSDLGWLISRTILSTKNSGLIRINAKVGSYKTFLSSHTVEVEDQNELRYPVELLNSLNGGSSLPDQHLQLKKGLIVMLLRNFCSQKKHVNGARYISNLLHLKAAVGLMRIAELLSQEFHVVLEMTAFLYQDSREHIFLSASVSG